MPVGFLIWIILCCLVGLVWLSRHFDINRAKRNERILSSKSYEGVPSSPPRLSVLVAAKDEEENIGTCVRSLLDQDYPDYELIIINDRSADRTAEILARLQGSTANGRLKVVTVTELKDGWFGKNNAMREGVERATGDWFCFADADCRQTSRRTLSVAMHEAQRQQADFLSVLPVLETRSFWERLLQPVCAAVMILWFRPDRVNDPKSKAAYANGAFMLISRPCYERIGGHERVKVEVNEDMHMARITKSLGMKLNVIQNDDLYVTRMYSTFRETWRGWSRIFYGCFGVFHKLAVSILVLLCMTFFPWCSLAAGAIGWALADPAQAGPWKTITLVSLAVVCLKQSVMFRFYRIARSRPAWALGYPLGAVICLGMLCNAMSKLGGRTRTVWRGTTYRGEQLETAGAATGPPNNHA